MNGWASDKAGALAREGEVLALSMTGRDRMRRRRSIFRADPNGSPDINTTPLIDVMLVMLVMFVITIPPPTHKVDVALSACRSGHRRDPSQRGQQDRVSGYPAVRRLGLTADFVPMPRLGSAGQAVGAVPGRRCCII